MTASSRTSSAKSRLTVVAMAGAVALLLGGVLMSFSAQSEQTPTFSPAGMRVEPLTIVKENGGRETFTVEVAETMRQLENGLMHRTELAKDAGMLFYFGGGEGEVSFWMKNTLIPLDMIFIRGDGVIVNIHESAEPHSLKSVPSRFPVMAVLEVNGGESRARGIQPGDRVEHHYFRARAEDGTAEDSKDAADKNAADKKSGADAAEKPKAEPAPLASPQLDIESPELLDRSRQHGLDADVQQR